MYTESGRNRTEQTTFMTQDDVNAACVPVAMIQVKSTHVFQRRGTAALFDISANIPHTRTHGVTHGLGSVVTVRWTRPCCMYIQKLALTLKCQGNQRLTLTGCFSPETVPEAVVQTHKTNKNFESVDGRYKSNKFIVLNFLEAFVCSKISFYISVDEV